MTGCRKCPPIDSAASITGGISCANCYWLKCSRYCIYGQLVQLLAPHPCHRLTPRLSLIVSRRVMLWPFKPLSPQRALTLAAALIAACGQSPAKQRGSEGIAGDMIARAEVAAARGEIPRAERIIDSALARDLDPERRAVLTVTNPATISTLRASKNRSAASTRRRSSQTLLTSLLAIR